ncbi:thioesterase II family protein [Plantactinospora sp. WMMC1484]|uniref:thioesterase II family protein n=1 Tax=Plantactinospora sp. WMMC1484 TaxID=3404122 RepID=UPI003BF5F29A
MSPQPLPPSQPLPPPPTRPDDTRWFARPRPVPEPRLRLFCVPHVGGGGAAFNSWPAHLPHDVELCAIRFPGRENRLHEQPVEDLDTLLDQLLPAIAPWLDRPFALLGHCSGSVIAFALARRLRALGGPRPVLLVVSSTAAPSNRVIGSPLHEAPRDELLAQVVAFGGMAPQILGDPDLMALYETVIRADYRVVERVTYARQPPLDIPITVIGGRDDTFVGCAEMAGWYAETTRAFTLHLIEGGHFILPDAGPVVGGLVRGMAVDG